MSDRLKRMLIATGFILVSLAMGYVVYYVFFRPAAPPAPPGAPAPVTGRLPGAGVAVPSAVQPPGAPPGVPGLPPGAPVPTLPGFQPTAEVRTQQLTDVPVADISFSPTGAGIRYYDPATGKFYRIQDDGTAVELSDQAFFNVQDVTWGHETDRAVLTFPDGSKILYDFTAKRQVTLPRHWDEFDFSPSDDRIVTKSIGNNETNRFLVVANADGTNAQPIEELGNNFDRVHVDWSANNQVVAYAFTGEPIGEERQNVVLVGQNRENFKYLVVEGRGFTPNWSPSGQNVLYSTYNSADGFRPTIWISGGSPDNVNENRRNIGLNTWADKCAWMGETKIACAVPTSLEEGAGLQREIAANTPDFIYTVDLQTGQLTNHGQPEGAPTIRQLTPSPDGRAVYYNDSITGRLFRFTL